MSITYVNIDLSNKRTKALWSKYVGKWYSFFRGIMGTIKYNSLYLNLNPTPHPNIIIFNNKYLKCVWNVNKNQCSPLKVLFFSGPKHSLRLKHEARNLFFLTQPAKGINLFLAEEEDNEARNYCHSNRPAHFCIEFELTVGPFEGSLVDHRICVQLPCVCAYLVEH